MRSYLLLAFLLLIGVANAQHGPRVGLGLAGRSFGGLFQTSGDLLPRPIIGWHFEAPVHPQLSIMPEILLVTKGFAVRNPAMATRSRTTLHYLEIPLLGKVSLDKSEGGIYLLAGPSLGIFLKGRYKQWSEADLLFDQEVRAERRTEFGGLVGMGMEGERWAFDVRAHTSLTPFERFTRIQNVVYSLTLAYRIRSSDKDREPADEKE